MSVLNELVAATHGAAAANALSRYVLSDADRAAVGQAGKEVLTDFPRLPGACVVMSALFAGRFEYLTNRPAYVVAGKLYVGQARIFGEDAPIDGLRRFSQADLSWDGHAWVVLGSYVIDPSIFRTAYSSKSPPLLARFVHQTFGEGRGLMMGEDVALARDGLRYQPQYVLSDTQVASLYRGAISVMKS